eukprot:2758436-Prorocentrum_lima.AAC.1
MNVTAHPVHWWGMDGTRQPGSLGKDHPRGQRKENRPPATTQHHSAVARPNHWRGKGRTRQPGSLG